MGAGPLSTIVRSHVSLDWLVATEKSNHRPAHESGRPVRTRRLGTAGPIPAEAKLDIDTSHLQLWLRCQSPRAIELISRRAGVRFANDQAA